MGNRWDVTREVESINEQQDNSQEDSSPGWEGLV